MQRRIWQESSARGDTVKIVTVVGARPQFIKAAPVSRELRKWCTEVLVHTGQHYDHNMSEAFFEDLEIPKPDYNLGLGGGSHGKQTGAMLEAIESVLIKEAPQGVLVYGDTNSTLAGALAAAKLCVPVFHVEAGLRSYNREMPEEINRVLTDHLSDVLFCPTEVAVSNLWKEGITDNVFNVGDVMYDAFLANIEIAKEKSKILKEIGLSAGGYLLATVHRAENTDNAENLNSIVGALTLLDHQIILPLHPRTRKALESANLMGRLEGCQHIRLIEPVGYLDMLALEYGSTLILTDSGGIQKEAFFLGKPCITLRDETEWVETVNAGLNVLAGADLRKILDSTEQQIAALPMCELPPYFGVGEASIGICRAIGKYADHYRILGSRSSSDHVDG